MRKVSLSLLLLRLLKVQFGFGFALVLFFTALALFSGLDEGLFFLRFVLGFISVNNVYPTASSVLGLQLPIVLLL
jgi:hypothetical protein